MPARAVLAVLAPGVTPLRSVVTANVRSIEAAVCSIDRTAAIRVSDTDPVDRALRLRSAWPRALTGTSGPAAYNVLMSRLRAPDGVHEGMRTQ